MESRAWGAKGAHPELLISLSRYKNNRCVGLCARRRLARICGDLVGDRQNRIESMLASDVDVRGDLLVAQLGGTRLDLDEASPGASSALADDRAIGDDRLARRVFEPHLGERLDGRRSGRAEISQQRTTKLRNGVHDCEER